MRDNAKIKQTLLHENSAKKKKNSTWPNSSAKKCIYVLWWNISITI